MAKSLRARRVGCGPRREWRRCSRGCAARARLIASHLRDNVPEGLIPDGERASDLQGEVASAIDALTQDESVPLPVRDLLLRRLHILWAVDHISVMGAGGIATACDHLAMAVAWTSPPEHGQGQELPVVLQGHHRSRICTCRRRRHSCGRIPSMGCHRALRDGGRQAAGFRKPFRNCRG